MQTEIITVLVIYLIVVFGLSFYAMRKRSTGSFLSEYFLGSRRSFLAYLFQIGSSFHIQVSLLNQHPIQ